MDALRAMLKKRGGGDLSCKDKVTGITIVHDTVHTGVVEILKMVLHAGASPHMINLRTGKFQIHYAVERGSFEMTSLLIRRATSYNIEEEMTGNTLLHIAVMSGHGFVIYFLISRCTYPRARNSTGETLGTVAAGAEAQCSAYAPRVGLKTRQMLAKSCG